MKGTSKVKRLLVQKIVQNTLLLLFLFKCSQFPAQEYFEKRNTAYSIGYAEVKESANFGLVFRGTSLKFGMNWYHSYGPNLLHYSYDIGITPLFRQGIIGLGFYLKPLECAYLFRLPFSKQGLFIGPMTKVEYNYNLYPDLQSGFDYWLSNFYLGLSLNYEHRNENSLYRFKLSGSLLGFTSRQAEERNPHFYEIGLVPALSHLHQELEVQSAVEVNALDFEFLYKPKLDSRWSLAYVLNFTSYRNAPELTLLTNSIKFQVIPKPKKKA